MSVILSGARDLGFCLRRHIFLELAETKIPRFDRDDKLVCGMSVMALRGRAHAVLGPTAEAVAT